MRVPVEALEIVSLEIVSPAPRAGHMCSVDSTKAPQAPRRFSGARSPASTSSEPERMTTASTGSVNRTCSIGGAELGSPSPLRLPFSVSLRGRSGAHRFPRSFRKGGLHVGQKWNGSGLGFARARLALGFLAIVLALGVARSADAQGSPRGSIAGKVVASTTGELLSYANIALFRGDARRDSLGSPLGGATSTANGTYRIEAPAGTYLLVASYVSYNKLFVSEVHVTAGGVLPLDLALVPEAIKVKTVEITASAMRSTVSALLSEQRTAPTVSDGISAEQIRSSPDGNSSDALKRVTGLSIVENKFVFVRGVTD